MHIEITLQSFGVNERRGFTHRIDFNELDLMIKEGEIFGRKLPTFEQYPHPAIMIWEKILEMKEEITPGYAGNRFNSYDPTKNEYGYPIITPQDVPAP